MKSLLGRGEGAVVPGCGRSELKDPVIRATLTASMVGLPGAGRGWTA